MSRRGGGRYVTKVKDVTGNLGRKVNLLGVVVEFSIPRKGNGTDYCTVLKIMDRSQQSPELCVNVFTENIHQLPHIRSRKDIILLCDINIRNDSQNPVWAVFSKSYSSFALFSGEDINDFIPYQASPRFCLLDSDKEFMRSLRTWCISFPYDGETSYREAEFATLMDLITWPQNSCKLKCVARVVALLPSQAEDFRSPLGHYRIRMTLEDPTTRIHALLSGEDATVGKKGKEGNNWDELCGGGGGRGWTWTSIIVLCLCVFYYYQ
ncbi:hypothetical protein RJ640_025849 [Escallonia rubra]|uniref:Telomeric single stranded DNA binding POT1/Cdc13 domain-containing protein n=1 Tax=Escallonia rubra TaxID=112253 RepID=A0AA88QJQ7_9ASTE|nr:hypothetical protein RJ640_025849 [Escallonia rubra]